MKKMLLLLILFPGVLAYGQEKELVTSIARVTVYLNGAQISRTGSIDLATGTHTLLLKGLSSYLDENSIQVNAIGDFTILAVNHRLNYLNEMVSPGEQEKLNLKIKEIASQINTEKAKLEVNKQKIDLLNANKSLGNETTGTDISRLKLAMLYFEEQLTMIKTNDLDIQQRIDELEKEKSRYQNQLNDPGIEKMKPSGEILIRVEVEKQGTAEFTVTYLTEKAGWFPRYDIRAKDIKNPVVLDYKARVYQNTGVDWKNVKLVLSNTNPSLSGIAPELDPWQLNYARYTVLRDHSSGNIREVRGRVTDPESGDPMPGVNIIVKGTSIGTVSDSEGFYSLAIPARGEELIFSSVGYATQTFPIASQVINVMLQPDQTQLSEVVVTGYADGISRKASRERELQPAPKQVQPVQTVLIENQTSVNFIIEKPYTVKSQDESLMVDIRNYEIPANYKYYAVPKVDGDAFLIASITDWNTYGLLEGEANLYFENTYIGKTILEFRNVSDTLELSLGRDKNVVIVRERINEFTKKRFLGPNKVDSRGISIKIRNNKSQDVELIVRDQVPVSVRNEISVDVQELSGASLEQNSGILQWELMIAPREQKELVFRYEVKYPGNETVILE